MNLTEYTDEQHKQMVVALQQTASRDVFLVMSNCLLILGDRGDFGCIHGTAFKMVRFLEDSIKGADDATDDSRGP
jgi:hypothetical protein